MDTLLIPRTKYIIEEVGSRTQCKIVFILWSAHQKGSFKCFRTFSPKIAELHGRVVTEQLVFYDEDASTQYSQRRKTKREEEGWLVVRVVLAWVYASTGQLSLNCSRRVPTPTPLREGKAGRNLLNEEITLLRPTEIG